MVNDMNLMTMWWNKENIWWLPKWSVFILCLCCLSGLWLVGGWFDRCVPVIYIFCCDNDLLKSPEEKAQGMTINLVKVVESIYFLNFWNVDQIITFLQGKDEWKKWILWQCSYPKNKIINKTFLYEICGFIQFKVQGCFLVKLALLQHPQYLGYCDWKQKNVISSK